MSRELRLLAALGGLVATTGCSVLLGDDERDLRRAGIMAFYGEPVSVTVPPTATVGVPFQVTVRTYGGGCTRMGGTDVGPIATGTRVGPYDFEHVGGDEPCPRVLRTFDHTASLTLTAPGSVIISFMGVREDGQGRQNITVERTVEVVAGG